MARFVYIDETGTAGNQPYLHVVAAVVDEDQVQPLAVEMRKLAQRHLGFLLPDDFEFHGLQIWRGDPPWAGKPPSGLIAVVPEARARVRDGHRPWTAPSRRGGGSVRGVLAALLLACDGCAS